MLGVCGGDNIVGGCRGNVGWVLVMAAKRGRDGD